MDTRSTLSEPGMELPIPATADEMRQPQWALERCLLEGYFCQQSPDPKWPSIEHIEIAHREEGMIDYFATCWPWDPSRPYEISLKRVMRSIHVEAFEREFFVKDAIDKTNAAWAKIMEVTAFQDKTLRMEHVVHEQADSMIRKLHVGASSAKKVQATETWRAEKIEELQKHLLQMEKQGMMVMDVAVKAMIHVWGRIRGQVQSRRASLASTMSSKSAEPQQDIPLDPDATMPMADVGDQLPDEEDFDPTELLQELESGMENLTLDVQAPLLVMFPLHL